MTHGATTEAEWLYGWDPTPGIVSVHAEADGRATVWRRIPATGVLVREDERFRPWVLLAQLDDVASLGETLGGDGDESRPFAHRELDGEGELRHLVTARDGRALMSAVLAGAALRLGRRVGHFGDIDDDSVLSLPPEEQYLVATGRTYFRDLPFDALHRLQFDLETTGLDARHDRVFMISVRYPDGRTEVLEANGDDASAEAALIRTLMGRVAEADPDVIENHNLHGFDLPFLDTRARRHGIQLALGRVPGQGMRQRAARRGVPTGDPAQGRRGAS
jgi:DNA polymerase I